MEGGRERVKEGGREGETERWREGDKGTLKDEREFENN